MIYLKENNYHFKSEGTNFLISSFGLPVINVFPIVNDLLEEENEVPVIELNNEQTTSKPNNRKYWWVAAALLPLVFYSAWIPLKTNLLSNKGEFHYSDLNPFSFENNLR